MRWEDLDEVVRIERLSYPNPWSKGQFETEFGNPVSFRYVLKVKEGGKEALAAYIIFWVVQGEAHVLNIAVDPDFRNRGFATELLRFSLDVMQRHGAYEVFLEVRRSNSTARRLYGRLGFREAFERKKYYGDEDAIVMTLEL